MDDFEVDDLVEVAITDETWVKGTVIHGTETRTRVKLDVPVLLIERTKTVRGIFRREYITETSEYLEVMAFGKGNDLVRKRN